MRLKMLPQIVDMMPAACSKLTQDKIDRMRAEMENVIRQQALTISQLEEELRHIELLQRPAADVASDDNDIERRCQQNAPDLEQGYVVEATMQRRRGAPLGICILMPNDRPRFPKTTYRPVMISGEMLNEPIKSRVTISQITDNSIADAAGLCVGDIICSVNGTDLSNATHEQTVEALNQAQEPIIVEVLRRPCNTVPTKSIYKSVVSSVSTQTEGHDSSDNLHNNRMFVMPSPPPINSSVEEVRSLSCTEIDQTYEVEYDEVTLRRTSTNDRIGLTLCYGETEEDGFTDIFIGEVEDNSVAGRNGKIQEGDQILKINNQDVMNREEAIRLFSESKFEITLMICRPANINQMDDGFLEECGSNFDMESFDSFSYHTNRQMMPLIEEKSEFEDDSTLTDTATLPSQKEKEAKDSGVGQDSAGSSEQECDFSHNDSLYDEHELTAEIPSEKCSKFRQILESRCMELADNTVEQLCEKLNQLQHENNNRVVPKMGIKIMHHNDSSLPRSMTESVDTAYNSLESSKSSATTLELTKGLSGSSLSLSSKPSRRTHEKRRSRRSTDRQTQRCKQTDIVYTTEDKLAETMATQQKMLLEQSRSSTLTRDNVTSSSRNTSKDNVASDGSNMEWVVKRRSDGTRYVTRRPIRSKIMNERKKRLESERCGMTTDDDTMSEMKHGRHWSKEDRRRHLQKSREYHQRKEMMQQKIDFAKKMARDGQANILELSHKKVHRHAMRDIDFTTVQELMAHGGKIPMSTSGLVSVTTV